MDEGYRSRFVAPASQDGFRAWPNILETDDLRGLIVTRQGFNTGLIHLEYAINRICCKENNLRYSSPLLGCDATFHSRTHVPRVVPIWRSH